MSESGDFNIDIGIEDYSPETIEKFSLLFASIPNDQFQYQAMAILQAAFEHDGQDEAFQAFTQGVVIKSAMMGLAGRKDGSEKRETGDPVIKPTDLL